MGVRSLLNVDTGTNIHSRCEMEDLSLRVGWSGW